MTKATDAANNLRFLIGLRHEIEHQMTMSLDNFLSARYQACALDPAFPTTHRKRDPRKQDPAVCCHDHYVETLVVRAWLVISSGSVCAIAEGRAATIAATGQFRIEA